MMSFQGFASTCLVAACVAVLPAVVQGEELPPTPSAQAGPIKRHRIVIQVDSNEASTMNLALNNASNIEQYYRDRGEKMEIEIVAFGPGLHMLRDDTSPAKARIKAMA